MDPARSGRKLPVTTSSSSTDNVKVNGSSSSAVIETSAWLVASAMPSRREEARERLESHGRRAHSLVVVVELWGKVETVR